MNWKKLSKKRKIYLAIALSIALVLVWACITAGVITHDFNRNQVQSQDNQHAVVKGLILTESRDGQKFWEVYGETGEWDSQKGLAQLNGVIGNFYKDNEVALSFQSSKGTYNAKDRDITLYEHTLIVMKGGITLRADNLHWINSKTPIVAQGHVQIQKGKELLSTADKIVISPTYDSFKISGNTISRVYEGK